MPTVDVLDLNKRKVGSAELPPEVFGCKPHATLVHEAVVMQRACERQGTASTLRRGEVRGSGKKAWKQKHTGRARAGSVRSPVWRHGGSGFRAQAEKLRVQHAEEEISHGAAKRMVVEGHQTGNCPSCPASRSSS